MENEILKHVDSNYAIELSKQLCRIPSPPRKEKILALFIHKELESLGFEVELQEVVNDRPNVVAILRGDPSYKSFIFNGHLDAAGPFGSWKHDPFDPWIENGILYATDLQDMKGGVATMIAGAAAVKQAGLQKHGDIIITAVMHHDTSGVGTKYFLESCPWQLDAGICCEPSNLHIQLFHSGAWDWQILIRGSNPSHQSRLEEATDPIPVLIKILSKLDKKRLTYTPNPNIPYLPRLVIGAISGGKYNSTTAEECIARGDVRYLPSMTVDGMKKDLQRLVDEIIADRPGLTGNVHTLVQQWPYQISSDNPIVKTITKAHRLVTGQDPILSTDLPCGAYITDGADMVRHGIATAFYGPGDWHMMPNEGVPVEDLINATKVYALTCADTVTQLRD